MKRMHVHLTVTDLDQSVRFYVTLFGVAPSVVKDDYAKWMLDDPRVNFAISTRAKAPGLDHLGIQVESTDDLDDVSGRLAQAGENLLEQRQATCCYAKSDKTWVSDPQGVAWETFVTFGDATTYGEDRGVGPEIAKASSACCVPAR
jgi:catechol 2,3-dioxygenase-like lactoylglutathione lyase family enzyme